MSGARGSGRPRVFVARRIPDEGLARVLAETEADLWTDPLPPPRDELLRRVHGVEGLLSLITDRVDDELLDAAGPGLRVVSNFAAGFDNIDVPACTRRGIPVGNTPGATETTADLAFGLLLAAMRRIPEGYDYVRAGKWKTWGPLVLLGRDVHHATLGIVGFGRIGREMAKRAHGFDMTVLVHDTLPPTPQEQAALAVTAVSFEELLARSDAVSLHVNLTAATRHLIDAAALARMKPTAILVNTSRGPVVDGAALADALRREAIGGAALDVTDPEPMRADDPLLAFPNCLVVPHIGSASWATRGKMAAMAAANLLAGLRGQRLPTPVNPEVYGPDQQPAEGGMPPLALGLVLVSAVLHASWNLLIARDRFSDVATAVAVPLGALLFLPFAVPTWRIEPGAWPYLAVSMVLELLYLTLLAAAYGRADLSLVYPLARGLAPVIVLIIGALALGLSSTLGEVAGVLAVGAGVLLVRGRGHGSPGSDDRAGTLLALAVAATIASYTLVDRQGLRYASPMAYAVLALGVPGVVYLALVARRRGSALVRVRLRALTALAGLAMFAGYGAALAALTIAPPASVSAGRESSVVIATILAAVVLKERVGPRRLVGSVLVVIGVALLALG